jgi:hypothetical protein
LPCDANYIALASIHFDSFHNLKTHVRLVTYCARKNSYSITLKQEDPWKLDLNAFGYLLIFVLDSKQSWDQHSCSQLMYTVHVRLIIYLHIALEIKDFYKKSNGVSSNTAWICDNLAAENPHWLNLDNSKDVSVSLIFIVMFGCTCICLMVRAAEIAIHCNDG